MKNIKLISLISLAFFITSCATPSKNKSNEASEKQIHAGHESKPAAPRGGSVSGSVQRVIDYPSVQRLLQLDRSLTQLGFAEKVFDTCQVGFGYAPDADCQKKYFTVIHFKLVCRESEGTISTVLTDNDLHAIAGENVKWYLKSANGATVTDSEGYGQIITTTSSSQRNQRLRLAVGADFLLTNAGDAKRLIAPQSWCNH